METPQKLRRKALRIAHDLREEYRLAGAEFSQQDFRDALALKLSALAAASYDAFVDHVAEAVDRQACERDEETNQPTLFDMAGDYKLGNGRRMPKWAAQIHHAEASMFLDDQNLSAVMKVNLRKREELIKLRPYWGPGVMKQQAIEAYEADHPEEAA